MNYANLLEENYARHTAFSFPGNPYNVDLSKVSSFDIHYKHFVSVNQKDEAMYRAARSKLIDEAGDIFHELILQANDEHEHQFLVELELQSLRLLNEELDYYRSAKIAKDQGNSQNSRVKAMALERHFFGVLSTDAISKILKISSDEIKEFRSRAKNNKVTRDDLSTNGGKVVKQIIKVLNKEFGTQGVLDAVNAYMGAKYVVGGLAIELSVPQSTWWRDKLNTSATPRTMYAHLDESIIYPKAIVYLSDVGSENGPTICYPSIYEKFGFNALQEIIGRVVHIPGSVEESSLTKYYGRSYHQAMSSENFRRHFMRLPPELRLHSHMGWDVIASSELESKFINCERTMTGPAGTFIVFDGGRLFHRGGLIESGERFVLQVIFMPPKSLYEKVISLPRRVISKIRRLIK